MDECLPLLTVPLPGEYCFLLHVLFYTKVIHFSKEKKRSEETQTVCAGCSKAKSKIFALLQTPFPGAWDGQNLISWRWSLPLPTNPV